MSKYTGESNPLYPHFSDDSSAYKVIQLIRQEYLSNHNGENGYRNFSDALIKKAREEVQDKRRALDASAYPFAQDFARAVLYKNNGHELIKTLIYVEGRLVGDTSSKVVVLPMLLEDNPYELFTPVDAYATIDYKVALEKTADFIENNRYGLLSRGFKEFRIDKSRFYYLKSSYVQGFLQDDGTLNMFELIPFIVPVKGGKHVLSRIGDSTVLGEVYRPSLERFKDKASPHVSYRLKDMSLVDKVLEKLSSKEGALKIERDLHGNILKEETIKDWLGFRGVVHNLEELSEVEKIVMGETANGIIAPHVIGKSKIIGGYVEDQYAEPKPSGYKDKTYPVLVKINGHKPCKI